MRPGTGRTDTREHGQGETTGGSEQAGHHVGGDLGPADVHAAPERGDIDCCRGRTWTVPGASDAAAARPRATQTSTSSSAFGNQSTTTGPVAEVLEPLGRATTRAAQHQQRGTCPHERHGERDDDVGHPAEHHQPAVDDADREAQQQDGDDDQHGRLIAAVLHERRGGDAGEGHHRTDRQVDAARDDRHRLAGGREDDGQHPDGQRLHVGRPEARPQDARQHEQAPRAAGTARWSSHCGG